jgi:hypothetical protein
MGSSQAARCPACKHLAFLSLVRVPGAHGLCVFQNPNFRASLSSSLHRQHNKTLLTAALPSPMARVVFALA